MLRFDCEPAKTVTGLKEQFIVGSKPEEQLSVTLPEKPSTPLTLIPLDQEVPEVISDARLTSDRVKSGVPAAFTTCVSVVDVLGP